MSRFFSEKNGQEIRHYSTLWNKGTSRLECFVSFYEESVRFSRKHVIAILKNQLQWGCPCPGYQTAHPKHPRKITKVQNEVPQNTEENHQAPNRGPIQEVRLSPQKKSEHLANCPTDSICNRPTRRSFAFWTSLLSSSLSGRCWESQVEGSSIGDPKGKGSQVDMAKTLSSHGCCWWWLGSLDKRSVVGAGLVKAGQLVSSLQKWVLYLDFLQFWSACWSLVGVHRGLLDLEIY